jgi:hypothetical protein
MTSESNFNVKPLTNVPYVAPANPSGEQPGRRQRPYKRKPENHQEDDPKQTDDDNGEDMRHVIDYQA